MSGQKDVCDNQTVLDQRLIQPDDSVLEMHRMRKLFVMCNGITGLMAIWLQNKSMIYFFLKRI